MRLPLTTDRRVLLGMGLSLAAAIAYGGSQVIGRKVVTDVASPLVASAFALLFGNIAVLLVSHRDLRAINTSRRALAFMSLAGLASGAGATSMLFALSRAPVVLVTPVAAVTPLIVLFLSSVFLKQMEFITPRVITGTLIVIGGVVLVIVGGNI